MLVYGDRRRSVDPARLLDAIAALVAESRAAPSHALAHDSLVAALIEAGMLAQGLADADMQARGCDGDAPVAAAAMALVLSLARAVARSWESGTARHDDIDQKLAGLTGGVWPASVDARQPEGYAYYSLYPELYYEAARGLPAETIVIGLRSIGTSLAAMVTAAAGGDAPPLTLRPTGHPFARHYAIDDACWRRVVRRDAGYALVDEGPGLSGSSFGALADRLEDSGVAREAIVMFPGHAGEVGREASPRHRTRWTQADRRTASFDGLVLPRLAAAVEDLTGPRLGPLEDVSAGRWRAHACTDATAWPPVDVMQERAKFLLPTARGRFLLKFAGLGCFGRAVLSDAVMLHAAGFGPEPLGLRLGFLVTRWEEPCAVSPVLWTSREQCVSCLGAYLGYRGTLPADDHSGADLAGLAEMTAHNIARSLGAQDAAAWHSRFGDLGALVRPRPVRTDNRLHAWEWFRTAGGAVLKADASDHCRAHDLVGCQDIAWDVAGAGIEFDLSAAEMTRLIDAVQASGAVRVDPTLVRWLTPAYLAFQLGSWTFAAQQSQVAEREQIDRLLDRYRHALRATLAESEARL